MRTIPATILERIKQQSRTDQKINLIMQRTRRYIEQGGSMTPFDLWSRPGLGAIDVAYRREDHLKAPDKIFVVYIEQGQAHVAQQDYLKSIEETNDWEYLYTLGPAIDCAIEFDGRWHRASKEAEVCFDAPAQWTHVTFGEPYIFLVLPDGSLTVQQGQGAPFELAPGGVTKCAALRGWKNVYRWNHDHGLICAYVRNTTARYRNFCMQGDNDNPLPAAWEIERSLGMPSPAQNVGLFRTNDYRVGILVESQGEIHWTVTDRNWAGMAIRDHTVQARGTGISVAFKQVTYHTGYIPHHTIVASGEVGLVKLMYGLTDNAFTAARNENCHYVIVKTAHYLTNLDPASFEIRDSLNTRFGVDTVVYGEDLKDLVITTANLNYSEPGDLTLKFLGSGATRGEAGQTVDPFEITFTPEGLDYIHAETPEVEAIWNE